MLSGALPLLGHAISFARDRGVLFNRGYKKLGDVFAIRLGRQKAAVLIGPRHHTMFYKETDKALDMTKPYQFMKPIFGNVAFVADHPTYLNQRPVLYSPFQREKMLNYLGVMDSTVRNWLDQLPDSGRIEITSVLNSLVQEVAGKAMLGDDFMTRAGKEFWALFAIVGKSMDPLLPPNLPIPKFIRRDKARKRMLAILRPILEDRRLRPEAFNDFLQDFINTPKVDGTVCTDEEILGLIIALMFAGHETTAGQAGWTIIQLLRNPQYLVKVQAELDAQFPWGARVDARAMANLSHVRWAIDETTRMRPSADISIRVADVDLEVDGYVIPKGWPVFITGEVAHFLPEVFENPEQYDPERFSSERSSHKQHKNAVMGFGGGVHKCPGMNFAQNEMLAITALLFQQFELELETLDTKVRRDLGANRPSATWIKFKRRPKPTTMQPDVISAAAAAGCPHAARLLQAMPAANQG
jgi:sterol 14-demethylase